ncbi:MAG: ImmA/IrrE family metallo-endopeptidase [Devosia sp.]|nr:ImmA/IrrE family metallo-endopeptidase [Devosia sp.]
MSTRGDMLRLARQRRGYQQKEAAALLGVSASDLSRIENGIKDASDQTIEAAARAFKMPPSFFDQRIAVYGAPVSVHPMWRKKAEVTAGEMDAVIAELNVRTHHLKRLLEAAQVNAVRTVPTLDFDEYGDAERIAGLVRAHWQVPSGPLRNLTQIIEEAGIVVAHSSLNGSSISGVTFRVPGMPPLIVLNDSQPADRMRFTLAHELGHIVMHRFPTPDMEAEANAFASYLLAPSRDIRPYFGRGRVDLPRLAALKTEWRMSMSSLVFVADRLGLLTPNQKVYIWKQFSMNNMRTREPPELDFPHEQPTVLPSVVRMHIDALGYSLGDLAAILHMDAEELPAFYGIDVPVGNRGSTLRLVK